MNEKERISIIVPVYNTKEYLTECLDSIVNQTYRNIEIILIDDGSTDGSGKICDAYAERDSRIIVCHQENGGVSAARNKGLSLATGTYLMWVDSDDWLELDGAEELYKHIDDSVAIVVGGFVMNDTNSKRNGEVKYIFDNKKAYQFFLRQRIRPSLWGNLYRRENFDGVVFSDKICEDELANYYIYKNNKCFIVKLDGKITYHYRTRENSVTHNDSRIWKQALLIVYQLRKEILNEDKTLEKDINYKLLYTALIAYGTSSAENRELAKKIIREIILRQRIFSTTMFEKKVIAKGFLISFGFI